MTEDKIAELENEINRLKVKYKSKCESLKKANKRIDNLKSENDRDDLWLLKRNLLHEILCDLTKHIEIHYYDIEYFYKGKIYIETTVESYGVNWLKQSLCIHMAKVHKLYIYKYDLKIIKATKLW